MAINGTKGNKRVVFGVAGMPVGSKAGDTEFVDIITEVNAFIEVTLRNRGFATSLEHDLTAVLE